MERPGEETLVNYFMGNLVDEEVKLIELYLSMEIDGEYVTRCMRTAAAASAHSDERYTPDRQLNAWNKFSLLKYQESADRLQKIKIWKRISVAAAVLFILSATYFFSIQPQSTDQQQVKIPAAAKTDHAPGTDKAMLILASGEKIDINGAKNGQVAKQGQTTIVKTADGKLIYEELGKSSNSLQSGLKNSLKTASNTLIVPRGGQYNLTLPDGSRVWLNAESSLIFPVEFKGLKREVTLSGEAYFEVAKNAKMPFHVKLSNMEVEVLGTHFNIMAYADEPIVKTTLLEGSVKLSNRMGQQLLKPGQEGILNGANKFLVKTANLEQAMAWKNGRFVFNNDDIPSISRKLARWYNVSVDDQRNNKSLTYTGSISKYQYVSEVLKMLELTGTMHYKIENRKVTITQP